MKTLKFRPHLVDEVLAGRKTSTWRLFDDKDLKINDPIELMHSETKEKFAEAIITKIYEKPFKEIEEKDFEGHEKFQNKEYMMETYRKYYGEHVAWDSLVKIIHFRVLKTNRRK